MLVILKINSPANAVGNELITLFWSSVFACLTTTLYYKLYFEYLVLQEIRYSGYTGLLNIRL